jgi:hypothetical protein
MSLRKRLEHILNNIDQDAIDRVLIDAVTGVASRRTTYKFTKDGERVAVEEVVTVTQESAFRGAVLYDRITKGGLGEDKRASIVEIIDAEEAGIDIVQKEQS